MYKKINFGKMQSYRLAFATLISLLILFLTVSIVTPASAEIGTLYVDDDGICNGNLPCYTVIQDAINAANLGDTVFVHAGIYYENLTFDKSLTLLAEDLDTTFIIPDETLDPITIAAEDVTITMGSTASAVASVSVMSPSANRYVDDDGVCGGNSPCYTTIQSAVNAANVGEAIYIYAGTYSEHVGINKSLTLQGEDRETTIIDGSGSGNVVYITQSNVTIDGVTVRNGDNGIYVIPNYSIHHFTFRNAIVTTNTTEGIEMGHSHTWGYHVLENCVISNNGGIGLYAHQFYNSVIRNCDVFGNQGNWALIPAWGSNTLITNNRVHDNAGSGIHLDSMNNSIVENNLAWNNGVGLSNGYVARNNTLRNNITCNNSAGIATGSVNVRYNRIYHNDVFNNTWQGWDELSANYWDNGYPSGGNFWNDYTGVDANNDGIGDTPYLFYGNQDRYPLITPRNFQPVVIDSITGPSQPVNINNQPVSVSAEFSGAVFSDPQLNNVHSAVWDWGDENTSAGIVDEGNGTVSGSHAYAAPGIYEVQLTVTNSVCSADTMAYQYIEIIENTPPEITVNTASVVVSEGLTSTNSGTISDADGDIVALSASVGAVTNNGDGTWSWSFPTSDGPAESRTITVTVDDGNGGITNVSFDLTVNNVAPAIDSVSVSVDPVNINDQPISAKAAFSDPAGSSDEPYACTVDYGDGSESESGIVDTDSCLGPDHTYTEPGVYAVTVTVSDKDGDSSSATATSFIVIYDPNGGFVTGGGWINSPLGAYTADPLLTGKATFGFISKYQKGATIPTGQTEFQFHVADLNFKSTSYNWLVIAGAKAQYKGTGTINGAGNFGFLLTAIDGSPDKFRIKIWDKATGQVIYDNQLGAGDDANPTTAIQGGSIVIHKAK